MYSLYAPMTTKHEPNMHSRACIALYALQYMLCPTCSVIHAQLCLLRHTHTYECKILCNIGPGAMMCIFYSLYALRPTKTCRAQHAQVYMHCLTCTAVHALLVWAFYGTPTPTSVKIFVILAGGQWCVYSTLFMIYGLPKHAEPNMHCHAYIALHALQYILSPTCSVIHAQSCLLRYTHTYECKNLCNIGPGLM